MCLIAFALDWHPDYPLILAGNRDEAYARPTAAAEWWRDAPQVCGGRDLSAGGGWLAMHRDGRLATVTNFRQPMVTSELDATTDRPSRGALVRDFVATPVDDETRPDWMHHFASSLEQHAARYAGFNLLLFDLRRPGGESNGMRTRRAASSNSSTHALAFSNRALPHSQRVTAGVHSLSNALFDVAWPKTRKLADAVQSTRSLRDPRAISSWLFDALADRTLPPDQDLPDTGIGIERERLLAPAFIETPTYGTRASTVVLVDQRGEVNLFERTFGASDIQDRRDASTRHHRFNLLGC